MESVAVYYQFSKTMKITMKIDAAECYNVTLERGQLEILTELLSTEPRCTKLSGFWPRLGEYNYSSQAKHRPVGVLTIER
jgi:hypothetical protein